MEDRLYLMLSTLADIETEIDGMIHILDRLDELYERDEQYETRCCEQVLKGWLEHIRTEVAAVADGLDECSLDASKDKK